MPGLLARIAGALLLVWTSASYAQDRPFTIDTALGLEEFGRSAFDPTGRFVVFERYRPYDTAARFDAGYYNRFTRSELFIAQVDGSAPARRLLTEGEGTGHVLGDWSPSGTHLLVYRFRHGRWEAGIYTVSTARVHWLPVTPELSLYGPVTAWRDDQTLILITRAAGDQPWHLRMGSAPDIIRTRLSQDQASGRESAIVVGSGSQIDKLMLPRDGALVAVTAETGDIRQLASGRFQDLQLSRDGRYAAVADEGEALAPNPAHPLRQGELQRRRHLKIIDLATGDVWSPEPDADLLPNLLSWSNSGDLLAWLRPLGSDWPGGGLVRLDPARGSKTAIDLHGVSPSLSATSEQLPVVRAMWMDDHPVVWGQADGERPDWHVLHPGGSRNLTKVFAKAPSRMTASRGGGVMAVADGAVWHLTASAASIPLTHRDGGLAEVRLPSLAQGLRPVFNNPAIAPSLLVQDGEGRVSLVSSDDQTEINRVTGRPQAVGTSHLLSLAEGPSGSAALHLSSKTDQRVLSTVNTHLADVQPAQITRVDHRGPDGEALTSWLYLPPASTTSERAPPLIIVSYPGKVFASVPPPISGLQRNTAVNVPALVGAGYAVLLPSLPRSPTAEPGAGLAAEVLAIVDAAAATGSFNPERLAVWGHSFGGYAALMIASQTDRFDAVIGSNGIYDLASQWGSFTPFQRYSPADLLSIPSSTGHVEVSQGAMLAPPWVDPQRYVRNSPLYAADRISAPVALIAGDLDYVGLPQAEMMFSALYRQNKDAVLFSYVGEGHVLASPANIRHLYRQILSWLDDALGHEPVNVESLGPAPTPGFDHGQQHDVAVDRIPDQRIGRQGPLQPVPIEQPVLGEQPVHQEGPE